MAARSPLLSAMRRASSRSSCPVLRSFALFAYLLIGVPACALVGAESQTTLVPVNPALERATAPDAALDEAVGELTHDGPPTPEQISLYLPVIGVIEPSVRARVRYAAPEGQWREAHPLFKIRPEFVVKGIKIPDAFAGVITGLEADVNYRIEVTLEGAKGIARRKLNIRTRALPASPARATMTVKPGSTSETIQAILDEARPGDVIEFAEGVYRVDKLRLRRSGTVERPIYVRGPDRNVVHLVDREGRVLHLVGASYVVVENLTLEGAGTDGGGAASSVGIQVWDGSVARGVTFRNLKIIGVDQGIVGAGAMEQFLVYDNTLVGNDAFEKSMLESKITWNDDGIRLPGRGHAIFNNTISGFGDAFAVAAGNENAGIHFYRNRVLFTGDDAFEGDYGTRNLTFYDNRVQNTMTLASFDPVYGGPVFVFRNVAINVGRQPYKLNNTNTGMFFYNNTVVRIPGAKGGRNWGWLQYNNGSLRSWGYRNNILVFYGPNSVAIESSGNDPIDFSHNAWYPDSKVWWSNSGGVATSLGEIRDRLPASTPVFGSSKYRHENDVVAERNPFEVKVEFPGTYDVPVDTIYEPKLSFDSSLRNAGTKIPGITDGSDGVNPDIGAIVSGRTQPVVGDRSR